MPNLRVRILTRVLALCVVLAGVVSFAHTFTEPPPVHAANINVDSNLDNALTTPGWMNDGDCTLREAIQNAYLDADQTGNPLASADCEAGSGTDTIIIGGGVGTITISNNVGAGEIWISSDVSFTGPATIDGTNLSGSTSMFVVPSGVNVTFNNFTFQNGSTPGAGGAIRQAGGILTINQGNFDTNHADGSGGAIDSGGELHINQTVFQDNSAGGNGGAISKTGANVMTVNTSAFLNNSAGSNASDTDGSGGAIYHSTAQLYPGEITAGYFSGNSVTNAESADGGGAIYHAGGILNIFASGFAGNTADGDDARGGAIANASSDDFAMAIEYSHFGVTLGLPVPLPFPLNILTIDAANQVTGTSDPTAGGGAIWNFGPLLLLGDSFYGNSSSNHGGAVLNTASVSDPPPPPLDNGVFFANSTFSGNTATGNGGAIYQNNEDDLLQLINVTIADNTAASGGGIYNTGDGESNDASNFDDVWIVNSILDNNTGGNCAGGELGNGNSSADGGNVVFNGACDIRQQDSSSTAAAPNTSDPDLQGPTVAFSLPVVFTLVRPIGSSSSAHANGDPAVCAAFPILNGDQQGILGLTRPSPGGTDCDSGAYESALPAPEPEIDVQGNAVSIADGDATPSVADDTDFGTTFIGTAVSRTYTIENTGTANLTVGAVTVPAGFTVTLSPTTPVTAGSTTTFTVQCDAASAATFSGDVSIVNNDSDENPYNFAITCTATGAPEIDLFEGGNPIPDGGTLTVSAPPSTRTITVTNNGTDILNLLTDPPTITGPLSVTNFTGTSVAAGGFSVTFDLTCLGASTGTVSFANNDSDENPYDFTVDCQVGPEIDLFEGGNPIPDGGTLTVSIPPSTRTITVTNNGTDILNLLTDPPTITGPLSVTNFTGTSVAAGGFSVTFDLTCLGTGTGTVSFANNDFDENPYNFTVDCQVGPEIDLFEGGNPLPDGGTLTVSTLPSTRTITVTNNGTDILNLLTDPPTITGPLSVTNFTGTSVAAGGFSVTFDLTCLGTGTGTVSFANNDFDENPYDFTVDCQLGPEMDVQGNAVSIADGDATPSVADDTDFGTIFVGTAISRTYTIENTGMADLTVGAVTVPAGFTVTLSPTTPVTAGSTTTFTVQCDAASAATFSGDVSIVNNDSNENPYNFAITCTVIPLPMPEMNVQGNGMNIADGDATPSITDDTDFGSTIVGTAVSRTYTVQNTGIGNLVFGAVTVPAGFTMTSPLPLVLFSGTMTTFTVQCNAASAATFSGDVSIVNNDGDENPYNFAVTCDVTAVAAPEIDVQGNAVSIADGDATPSVADDTDFGATMAGVAVSRTYTIENAGTANLTVSAVTVPAGFTVTLSPTTPVTAGTTTTFTVQCDAASAATFSGDVSIDNTDSNENPYKFAITCTVNPAAPEMDVQGNAVSIADGDATPSVADDTDFGTTFIGTAISRTYTIENTGTANLTVGAVTVPAGFTVTLSPTTPVTAGSTTTFTVQCDAASAATFSGDVSIVNNDTNENPYNFAITCTVNPLPTPEMNVQGNGMNIADGDTTPSITDDTDFGSTIVGTAVSRTYTVQNTGTGNLVFFAVTVPAGFTMTSPLPLVLFSGTMTTFTVQCDAGSAATFSGDVSIDNNDSDENPYNFAVTCDVTAVAAPEIDVQGNTVSIADGDATPSVADDTDFGATTVGTAISRTYTIENTGTANLTVGAVTVPAGFTVTLSPTSPVTAGNTTTFTVQCDAGSAATFTGDVSIVNNDSNENPYNFAITCDVTAVAAPEIDVQGNAVSIADGDATPSVTDDTDFGATTVGTALSQTYTIENTGTANLTVGAVTVPAGFTVTLSPTTPVTAGSTTTFTVQCDAASAATFTGDVSIVNNDSDENPYNFAIACNVTAVAAPEIDVQGNAVSIADGDATPSVADDTDFGATVVGTAISRTYTIENTGTADLTVGAVTVPAGFTVTLSPTSPVTAGNTTTFTVQCGAGSAATFSGDVSIVNNDSNENPYNFAITCNVTAVAAPEIDVQGNAVSIADGDATPSVTDDTDFGATTVSTTVSRTYTIENTGTADLTVGAVIVPAGFTVTLSPTSPVTAGNSTTFTVQCDAGSAATFTGDVSIVNNDSDEAPYNFAITCNVTAVAAPEIVVEQGVTNIADGGAYVFPASTTVGTAVTQTITVRNTGSAALDLLTDPPTVTGAFAATNFSATTVAPAGSVTFDLTCSATVPGNPAFGMVSFDNTDGDENPFNFAVGCTVVGTAANLAFVEQPTDTVVNTLISPAVTVAVQDTVGNTILTDNTTQITLVIAANPGGGVLTGGGATTVVNGVATFAGLSIDAVGNGYTLQASSVPVLTPATSNPFNITDSAPVETPVPPGPQVVVFDPAMSKAGALPAGGLGLPGEQVTWFITVSNVGATAGTDIQITDTVRSELRIDSVQTDSGTHAVNGQTVTFFIPTLAPGQTVHMQIFTTVLSSSADGQFTNTAILIGSGQTRTASATVIAAAQLPTTGYRPADDDGSASRTYFVWMGLALGALGVGLILWRVVRSRSQRL